MKDWIVWQKCLLHTSGPHCSRDFSDDYVLDELKSRGALFARWTTGWDCGHQTRWWYCIKDTPVDLNSLSAKARYRINKGKKNIEICLLNKEQILVRGGQIKECLLESYMDYPKKYRPRNLDAESFLKWISQNDNMDVWIGVHSETQEFCGFATCEKHEEYVSLVNVKIPSRWLSTEINAIMAYRIIEHYINNGTYKYICDGERNIRHETKYQDYLVRVLGFRYAYCKLNVIYRPFLNPVVKVLFPFRKVIASFSYLHPFIYNLVCLLKQEEIARSFR